MLPHRTLGGHTKVRFRIAGPPGDMTGVRCRNSPVPFKVLLKRSFHPALNR